jgi:hypothetical protein
MEIDSVRELKRTVLDAVVRPLVMETLAVRGFGLTARLASVLSHVRPGLALGIAPGRAKKDFRLAVRIQRRTLHADSQLLSRIMRSAQGEVDVRYVGRIAKAAARRWYQTKQRPLLIGSSIGHFAITAGTLGCFVTHPKIKGVAVLSNNHVLANENRAKNGDAILQPGTADGGKRGDQVATLQSFVPLKSAHNALDAAIATVRGKLPLDLDKVKGFGRVKAYVPDPVEPGLKVVKLGRTTGLTRGKVTATEVDDVTVAYESGDFAFDRVFEIESERGDPFGLGGDSGSLIMDRDGHARGLLFAVSDQGGNAGRGLTYAPSWGRS